MAIALPSIHVVLGGEATRVNATRVDALLPDEIVRLRSLDEALPVQSGRVDRGVALGGGRVAIGRRVGELSMWRVVPAGAMATPAFWLLPRDEWFDWRQAATPQTAPPALSLRQCLRQSKRAMGGRQQQAKLIARLVRAARQAKPVQLRVPAAWLADAEVPAQWMLFSLLSALPPAVAGSMSWSIGAHHSEAGSWDLLITDRPQPSYTDVSLDGDDGEADDLVAYFIRNRLLHQLPEAVEAAAHAEHAGQTDPWVTGIRAQLSAGLEGASVVTPAGLAKDPEAAVRALVARLSAGAAIDQPLLDALLDVTVIARDARPWRALLDRAAVDRARAVQYVLSAAPDLAPRRALLDALMRAYPPGADLPKWCGALLRWLEHSPEPEAVLEGIESALASWPDQPARAARTSVWSAAVSALLERGEVALAISAVTESATSAAIAAGPDAESLADLAALLPVGALEGAPAASLATLLTQSPRASAVLARLLRQRRESKREAESLLSAWVELKESDAFAADTPLSAALIEHPALSIWLALAVLHLPEPEARAVGESLTRGPEDPAWLGAEAALAARNAHTPRARLLSLNALAGGLPALETLARSLLHEALPTLAFPDAEICDACCLLLDVPGASHCWMWVALCSAPPLRFDDDTIDATVVALGEVPPSSQYERTLCADAVAALARAPGLTAVERAQWLVRLLLGPDGDDTGFLRDLSLAYATALAKETPAGEALALVYSQLVALPPNHPALRAALFILLPELLATHPDARQALRQVMVPPVLRGDWARALGT